MTWYVEFEVDSEKDEMEFWKCVANIGKAAQRHVVSPTKESKLELRLAALDFARVMNYID